MSYSLRKEQIIQDAGSEDGDSDVPQLASEGSDYSGSDDEGPPPRAAPPASNGRGAAPRAPAAGGRAAPQAAAAAAASGGDDMPGLGGCACALLGLCSVCVAPACDVPHAMQLAGSWFVLAGRGCRGRCAAAGMCLPHCTA